jgi:hydroxyacylglutathione hydrolase
MSVHCLLLLPLSFRTRSWARFFPRHTPPVFFRQVLHGDLGCASYVFADGGEAAVVDPKWEIEDYLALAGEHDFRVAHILETHNHADHLSGRGRLAEATGAVIHISAEAGVDYEHEPIADGEAVELGEIRLVAVATPGHRPEHLAYTVEDTSRSDAPWLVLTGDSLFVGDVARPDLAVDPEEGARGLCGSLRTLLELEDFTEVWPGHIGGSLCGGSGMSEKPGSTIGFERRFNPIFALAARGDEEEFVRVLTNELAPQPPNFKRIVELNRGPLLTAVTVVEPLAPARTEELAAAGAVLLDGRDPREFDAAHIPDSLNVTMSHGAVGTRAAWVVDPEQDVIVVAASEHHAQQLAQLLEAVGFRSLRGFLAGGLPAWQGASLEIETTPAIDAAALAERLDRNEVVLLDVRDEDEWSEGHVADSVHAPYYELRDGPPDALPWNDKPVAVACAVGNRSSLAASLLRRAGFDHVLHVAEGGVPALKKEGIELVREGE